MSDQSETAPPSVPPAEYIEAIAQHVSSVCVVTTDCDGTRFGLTATAVSSVSAEPPRLLACINRNGLTHDKILASGRFCVNVLTEDQDKIAMAFAGMSGPEFDRFSIGRWGTLSTGAPVLENAVASFDCLVGEALDQASHTVLFGDVVGVSCRKGQDTLLYGGRKFRQLRRIFGKSGDWDEYL